MWGEYRNMGNAMAGHKRFALGFIVLFAFFLVMHASYASAEYTLLDEGIAEYRAGNYEEALEVFKKVRTQEPSSSLVAFYTGLAYKQTGKSKEAAQCYREAATLTPPVKDAYVELIEMLYNLNELGEAKTWIAKAEEADIKPASVAFLKGLVLTKEGDRKGAISAFKKTKELDPSLAQAADLQLAMAYTQDKKFSEAKEALKAVITANPTSELANFAREYESSIARVLETYKAWRFSLGASYEYDDNVISSPSTPIGTFTDIFQKGKRDSGIVNTFNVSYTPLLSGPWVFSGQYNFYSNTYFHTSSHDLMVHSLSLIPGYNFQPASVTLPLTYSYAWLNERKYLSIVSAKPTVTAILFPGHIGQFSAGYGRRDMLGRVTSPDENRDADLYSISAGYIYPFAGGQGIFNLRYEYTWEDTTGRNWQNSGSRISSSILIPVMKKTRITLSGDALLQDYWNIHTITKTNAENIAIGLSPVLGYPNTPTKRRDRTYTGVFGVTHEVLKDLNINAQYTYTRAESNFAIYDYKRNTYMAGLEYSF